MLIDSSGVTEQTAATAAPEAVRDGFPPPAAGDARATDAGTNEGDAETGDSLPITHEIIMKDHAKVNSRANMDGRLPADPATEQTVSALSVDPAGARVVSGSYDYDCKLWDFGGMTANFKPFRSFECKPGHQVRLPPVVERL